MSNSRIRIMRGAGLAAAIAVGACSPGDLPTDPVTAPLFDVVEREPARVWICKVGPEGTTADFTVEADGPGELLLGETFTIDAYPECVWGVNTFYFWEADSPRPDPLVSTTLTVTEVDATEGMELALIDYAQYMDDTYSVALPPAASAQIVVNYDDGGRFKFVNEGTPPPPPLVGGEGCTPGYWKQKHHFDSYPSPYTPDMLFADAFGAGFPGMTLVQVASQGGGGVKRLGRHAVAALLSSASDDVAYDLSTSAVIDAFNDALASGGYEAAGDLFEKYNEQGCPLN